MQFKEGFGMRSLIIKTIRRKEEMMTKIVLGVVLGLFLTLPVQAARLKIVTIPQEDQLRHKGMMSLCSDGICGSFDMDLHAEYKMLVTLDGVNVDPDTITCKVIEKEVCHVGSGKFPAQFEAEIEGTDTFDVSDSFVCKFRKSPVAGTGVLEVYFTGNDDPIFIGDHILKVEATKGGVQGAEIQDICILDFPTCRWTDDCQNDLPTKETFSFDVKWPENSIFTKFADPLSEFASCKNAALWQREVRGENVQQCLFGSGTIVGTDGAVD
jgi:hypothetical protein